MPEYIYNKITCIEVDADWRNLFFIFNVCLCACKVGMHNQCDALLESKKKEKKGRALLASIKIAPTMQISTNFVKKMQAVQTAST